MDFETLKLDDQVTIEQSRWGKTLTTLGKVTKVTRTRIQVNGYEWFHKSTGIRVGDSTKKWSTTRLI